MALSAAYHCDERVCIKVLSNISAVLLAGVLAVGCLPFSALNAYADEVSDAQSALDSAEAQLKRISAEHETLIAQADELQSQIDEAVQEVLDAQSSVQEGRAKLGTYASQEYKMGGLSLVQVILESQNISDLVSNIRYFDAIREEQAREIAQQRQREETFSEALNDLNAKKDSQQKAIADAASKETEATQVVASAATKLSNAQSAAEAARLAELQKQAEALAAQQAAEDDSSSGQEESQGAAGKAEESPGSAANQPADTTDNSSSGGSSDSGGFSSEESDAGWSTGLASAYGSTSDGTLGAHTATGALVTESSMGVAVPMSWPNFRSYYGHTVEISYGGRTVIAVVNDCGGLGGGSRSLDLQPGVWKALGASNCFDWGVRTVSYRFL